MRHSKGNRSAELCDELRPDDGVDPRVLFRRETRTRDQTRRDRQLCKHAWRVFSLVLDQVATEDWARGMFLAEVTPAPDASRLRVAIAFIEPRTLAEAERALDQLRGLASQLRWELAATISRRRVPELEFGLAREETPDDQPVRLP